MVVRLARRCHCIALSSRDLLIKSPHGHTEPQWFAEDIAITDPALSVSLYSIARSTNVANTSWAPVTT